MERLNKKQRQILGNLYKKYPDTIKSEIILGELNCDEKDLLADVIILNKHGLITAEYEIGRQFPTSLTITPDGIVKLRENLFTRLIDSGWKNPWVIVAIILTLITIGSNIYFSVTTENIQVELNEVKGIIAEYDTIIVKNTTSNTISVPCSNGTKPQIILDDNGTFIICE